MMKVGIVGCGFISNKHITAIENIENLYLSAVCDPNEDALIRFKEDKTVKTFTKIEDMLNDSDIDIVAVCTPSGLHKNLAIKAAKAGKHLVIEKPIAMKVDEALEISKVANEENISLSVVHPNRFRPVVMSLKKLLDKNVFGKISHVECNVNWNRNQEYYDKSPWRGTKEFDGGVLMNQAIHNLDLLLWFIGRPDEIFSMEATRLRKIEAEDVSMGIVRFQNGILGIINASTTVFNRNFEESITIFGEKGTAKIGGTNALYFKHLEYENMDEDKTNKLIEKINNDPWGIPGHECIYRDLLNAIELNSETAVSGEEATKSLRLVEKMYESAEKGQVVKWEK